LLSSKGILKLAKDKELRERLGENGYKVMEERYDNEIVVTQIEDLYKGLIKLGRENIL